MTTMAPSAPNTKSHSVKPAPITRAESAPPTRGREYFEKPVPLPTAPVAPSHRPPTNPATVRKTNGAASSGTSGTLRRPKRMLPRDPRASRCSLAMSRAESVLVSASGDVMVCRCRRSSTPYMGTSGRGGYYSEMEPWTNLIPCCDADFFTEGPWSPVFESLAVPKLHTSQSGTSEGSTYEWENMDNTKPSVPPRPTRSGGPDSPSVDQGSQVHNVAPLTPAAANRNSPHTSLPGMPEYQAPTTESLLGFNTYDGGLLPLPSFDYSHFSQGDNDMLTVVEDKHEAIGRSIASPTGSQTPTFTPSALNRSQIMSKISPIAESPEEKKDEQQTPIGEVRAVHQHFYHGIPIFLASLSQIRVSKVSSHPLGAHVLLISEEALLFSYGLNNHGQLGIGVKSDVKDESRGFVTTPTLITPLLENGGKAIHCAAGVDHSLVVVATEGQRIHRLRTCPDVAYSDHDAAMTEHSGAATPSQNNVDDDSVRYHQLYGFGSNDFMKLGLVGAHLADDVTEGDGEDILLPHRVALNCTVWPQEADFEDVTAFPPQGIFDIAASAEHSAALVRRATGDIEIYMWGHATLGALGLPVTQDPKIEKNGKFTLPTNNIFPVPTILETLSFRPHRDCPLGFPRQVSLGPHCSFVVMSTGRCMSFGFSAEGMLGHGCGRTHTMVPKEIQFSSGVAGDNGIVALDAGAYHVIALTGRGEAYSWGINSDDRLGHGPTDFVKIVSKVEGGASSHENVVIIEWAPQKIDFTGSQGEHGTGDAVQFVEACAGYDSSMLVARSGEVYSFGKRSGRLGKGEVATDVSAPQPLHGGLRLFFAPTKSGERPPDRARIPRPKAVLKRILSDGAFCT